MCNAKVGGFVSAREDTLVNGQGEPFLLRGVGLGNWLLPEGYMWQFKGWADRPRRIEQLTRDLLGEDAASRFWEVFRDRYIGEEDIRRIAREGFNSIRLPMNARTLLSGSGSQILDPAMIGHIDRIIEWCREHGLYVILDLHGAPGGQTGTNIDDSENDLPELFLSQEHQQTTVDLWRELARRYRDEWTVAGYDLLNEPLPEWFGAHNDKVLPLYSRIVKAIRAVDRRHLIILEGVHWATDWSVFTDRIDDNLMLQFHKYWNNPDPESLRPFLRKRSEWNVPIFMGEGGENNLQWYAGAFGLYEDFDISWNFWTWKKLDTSNSPVSIRRPPGWENLVAYAAGGEAPAREEAQGILHSYLENLPTGRCDYRPDVVNAILRRPSVTIPAVFYSYEDEKPLCEVSRTDGSAAETTDTANAPDVPRFRVSDDLPIRFAADGGTLSFEHTAGEPWTESQWLCLELATGDRASYTLEIPADCDRVDVEIERVVRPGDGDADLLLWFGGAQSPTWVRLKAGAARSNPVALSVEPGVRRLTIRVETGSVRLKALKLS